jgi:hypothetical protein
MTHRVVRCQDLNGIRTCDLSACSIVPQPTTLPRVPLCKNEQLQLQDSLQTAVRQLPGSKDVNKEAEEATAMEAITRRQLVKIQQTKKT